MKVSVHSGTALAAAAAALLIANVAPTPASAVDYSVKCFGLNACKGHGGCKSIGNACKGKNACKGQGFSMMSKSQCLAKGGKTARG